MFSPVIPPTPLPIKTMKRRPLFAALLLTGFASLFSAQAAEEAPKPKAKPYPLETCIVSGEKLGGMGKPMVFEYKGQEVKLCCKSCKSKFDKDADALLKKIQETPKKSYSKGFTPFPVPQRLSRDANHPPS